MPLLPVQQTACTYTPVLSRNHGQQNKCSDPTFKPSKKKRKTVKKGALSFGNDEDNDSQTPTESLKSRSSAPAATKEDKINEEDDSPPIKKRLAANSNVGFMAKSMSKSALLREAQTREQLRKDFLIMQEAVKQTDFLLPFVFYDGTNIPGGQCRMKKGDMVWLFLDRARKVGAEVGGSDKARREWARVGVDDLMLVKGDIIIPHVRFHPCLSMQLTDGMPAL